MIPTWAWAFLVHEALVGLATIVPFPDFPGVLHRAFGAGSHLWFQWDALWYIAISRYGYAHMPAVPALAGTAFFPWLPILIRLTGIWGAWLLTQASLAVSLWLLNRLFTRLHFSPKETATAVFLFAINPAAVYYSTLYAEPWTVLFALASIDFGQRRRWLWAAVAGFLAATTQATGILIGLYPLIELISYLRTTSWKTWLGPLVWGLGPFLGLCSYAAYLGIRFGKPLLFSSIQGTKYWHGIWRWPGVQWYRGIVAAFDPRLSPLRLALWIAITLFLVGAGLLAWRSRRPGSVQAIQAGLYAVVGILLSLSFYHGDDPLYSTVRIASIYFPIYGGLARAPRWLAVVAVLLFVGLAFYGAMLFTHRWWYQ